MDNQDKPENLIKVSSKEDILKVLSYNQIRDQIRNEIRNNKNKFSLTDKDYTWVVDVLLDNTAIIEVETSGGGSKLFQIEYSIENDEISFGSIFEVEKVISYKPITNVPTNILKSNDDKINILESKINSLEKKIIENNKQQYKKSFDNSIAILDNILKENK